MAIVGRDLDASERKVAFQYNSFPKDALVAGGVGNSLVSRAIGISQMINMFMVPFPCTIQSGVVAGFGLSGAPEVSLKCLRWTGSAMATFAIGISNMVLTALATSGPQGFSGLPAAGSTLLNLQLGDILQMVTSGANTAMDNIILELVVKKTQDIVAYNNVST